MEEGTLKIGAERIEYVSRQTKTRESGGKVFVDILQANKVTKSFGELAAVKDLSFEVERGEIFGIA